MKKVLVVFIALIIGSNAYSQSPSNNLLAHKIDSLFAGYSYHNRFVGSVLISKGNGVVYQKSFGFADAEKQQKNTESSIFSIASLSKSLTAAGVMKLVEDGKLTLEMPISLFFPDFMPDFSNKITIQHLLNNSSGMEANIGRKDNNGNGLMPMETPVSLNEVLDNFKASKLIFEPGTGYDYNNFGYLLLANIIEKVSGQSFADFMGQRVFSPAGMKNTSVAYFNPVNQKSQPYLGLGMADFEKFTSPFHASWLKGAADINSTTVDLYKFMQALDNGVLLKPASVNEIYTKTQAMGVNEMTSGLGWVIDHKGDEEWVYNSGLLPGYSAMMGTLPEAGVKVIILSNATAVNPAKDEFPGEVTFVPEITDKVIALVQGREIEYLPVPGKIENNDIVYGTKEYQLDNEHSLFIKKEGEGYILETAGEEPWSVFTYAFSRNANVNNPSSEAALFFANAMSSQDFAGLTNYANDQMKEFLGSDEGLGQLKGMWANFLQHAGKYVSHNIYNITGDDVKNIHIRFHFETVDIGIVVSVNGDDKIQGLFMDDSVRTSKAKTVSLLQISENEFFINGHQNGGMQDLKITVSKGWLSLKDGSIEFKAEGINP